MMGHHEMLWSFDFLFRWIRPESRGRGWTGVLSTWQKHPFPINHRYVVIWELHIARSGADGRSLGRAPRWMPSTSTPPFAQDKEKETNKQTENCWPGGYRHTQPTQLLNSYHNNHQTCQIKANEDPTRNDSAKNPWCSCMIPVCCCCSLLFCSILKLAKWIGWRERFISSKLFIMLVEYFISCFCLCGMYILECCIVGGCSALNQFPFTYFALRFNTHFQRIIRKLTYVYACHRLYGTRWTC